MELLLLCMGSLIKGSSESIPWLSPVVPRLFRAAAALPGIFLSSQSQEQLLQTELGLWESSSSTSQLAGLRQIRFFPCHPSPLIDQTAAALSTAGIFLGMFGSFSG